LRCTAFTFSSSGRRDDKSRTRFEAAASRLPPAAKYLAKIWQPAPSGHSKTQRDQKSRRQAKQESLGSALELLVNQPKRGQFRMAHRLFFRAHCGSLWRAVAHYQTFAKHLANGTSLKGPGSSHAATDLSSGSVPTTACGEWDIVQVHQTRIVDLGAASSTTEPTRLCRRRDSPRLDPYDKPPHEDDYATRDGLDLGSGRAHSSGRPGMRGICMPYTRHIPIRAQAGASHSLWDTALPISLF